MRRLNGAQKLAMTCLVVAMGWLAATPAAANQMMQTPEFERMFADGFSPATALAFAERAVREGDPDSAIAALEQSLRQHESDPVLHQKLAELYRQIGNAEMAGHHAKLSGSEEHVPKLTVWGRASVGFAHDSNPTAAESSSEVRI